MKFVRFAVWTVASVAGATVLFRKAGWNVPGFTR